MNRKTLLGLVVVAIGVMFVVAQDGVALPEGLTPLPASPSSQPAELTQTFSSKAAGIAFKLPASLSKIPRPNQAVEQVAQYLDEKSNWSLRVDRMTLDKPTPLLVVDDPDTVEDESKARIGMMSSAVEKLKADNAGSSILRLDKITGGKDGSLDIGLLAIRFTLGTQRFLRQQAIVQGKVRSGISMMPNDQLYYILDLTTPTDSEINDAEKPDPRELVAVETFERIIDSVELFDLSEIIRDTEDRLFRTRTLYLNLKNRAKIANALLPAQWYLINREGKPFGYALVIEKMGKREKADGVIVALWSRTYPAPKQVVEVASEMFCGVDRSVSSWSNVHLVGEGENKRAGNEMGRAVLETRKVEVREPTGITYRQVEEYNLVVTIDGKVRIDQALPPFYLPEALGHLMPRLIPLNDPKTYMFASWVGSERVLMRRFVDVERQRQVTIGGRNMQVLPIQDRLGLEGMPTWHYFDLNGKYVGSYNDASKTESIVSDFDTVRAQWPADNLNEMLKSAEKVADGEIRPAASTQP